MVTQHRENWKSRKRDRKKLGQRETMETKVPRPNHRVRIMLRWKARDRTGNLLTFRDPAITGRCLTFWNIVGGDFQYFIT